MGNTGSLRRGSALLQDASDLARFERVRSGDKGQGESTVLKWPQAFYRNLVFLSKPRKYVQKSQKKFFATEERA